MFGKFMNNYFYGKSGKGDYTTEDLPSTRGQLFRETLRTRLGGLMRLNLIYVLAWVPAMVVIVYHLMTFYAMLSSFGDLQAQVQAGTLAPAAIDEAVIEKHLYRDLPPVDLMIRTSGELRLSNYLLWQLAYSEFYFTDVPWPDFKKEELVKAIEKYNERDRRYGGVKEE